MKTVFTKPFVRDYQRLPQQLQEQFDKALGLLLSNPHHPSLRARKLKGQRDPEGREIWEARLTRSYRFTFVIDGDTYIFYRIGPHDIERRPR